MPVITMLPPLRTYEMSLLASAIAGGVGAAVVVGDVKVDEVFAGMLDGLSGPIILYSFLYLVLKGALWAIAIAHS
ncbi:hypothetical protein C0993_005467 [Termitomyces sp. T159_Od127]|nr:hypothetical protein C0993_005467 [Termitomyces sp. T159_Od127]